MSYFWFSIYLILYISIQFSVFDILFAFHFDSLYLLFIIGLSGINHIWLYIWIWKCFVLFSIICLSYFFLTIFHIIQNSYHGSYIFFYIYISINNNSHTLIYFQKIDRILPHSFPTLQACISSLTASYNRELLFSANEGLVILLQAYSRGYLTRKAIRNRMKYLKQNTPAISRIQVWW